MRGKIQAQGKTLAKNSDWTHNISFSSFSLFS